MEVQLQELIDKIKSEGVASAKADAERIEAEATLKARAIIANAEAEVAEMMQNVKKEEALATQRGREALSHAGRDLLLSLNNRITQIFDVALAKGVADSLKGDNLVALVSKVLSGLDAGKGYEITLSEADTKALADELKKAVASQTKAGLDIKANKAVTAGFRLSERNGGVFYDFTAETIAENLGVYVNEVLAEELKKAAGLVN